jgi:hypothetical protein
MADQTNLGKVRGAWDAQQNGDFAPMMALYGDDFTWTGWDLHGSQTLYSRKSLFESAQVLSTLDDATTKLKGAWAIGDDIIACDVHAIRRRGNIAWEGSILIYYRFTDGKITHGGDACPAGFDEFWKRIHAGS